MLTACNIPTNVKGTYTIGIAKKKVLLIVKIYNTFMNIEKSVKFRKMFIMSYFLY